MSARKAVILLTGLFMLFLLWPRGNTMQKNINALSAQEVNTAPRPKCPCAAELKAIQDRLKGIEETQKVHTSLLTSLLELIGKR